MTCFSSSGSSTSAQLWCDWYSDWISTYIHNSFSHHHHHNALLKAVWSIIHFWLPVWILCFWFRFAEIVCFLNHKVLSTSSVLVSSLSKQHSESFVKMTTTLQTEYRTSFSYSFNCWILFSHHFISTRYGLVPCMYPGEFIWFKLI